MRELLRGSFYLNVFNAKFSLIIEKSVSVTSSDES